MNLNVLANDFDADGDPLTVTSVSTANGTAIINGNGVISYWPNLVFTGTDTFSYSITDGKGGSDSAVVTMQVNSTSLSESLLGFWSQDGNRGNRDIYYDEAFLSSISDLAAGPGVTEEPVVIDGGNTAYQVTNVNSTTAAEAMANQDYVYSRMSLKQNAGSAAVSTFEVLRSPYPGFSMRLTIVDSGVETILVSEVRKTVGSNLNEKRSIANPYTLIPGKTYEFRIYLFAPDGEIYLDNPGLHVLRKE